MAGPYIANLTNTFDLVYEFTIVLHFTDSNYIIEDFGGDSALNNGVNAFYNGVSLFSNVNLTSNDDMDQLFDDFRHQKDELGVPAHQLVARYEFPQDIIITNNLYLQFYVQDDITSLTTINEFFVRIQGWEITYVDETTINEIISDPGDRVDDLARFLLQNWGFIAGTIIIIAIFIKKVFYS